MKKIFLILALSCTFMCNMVSETSGIKAREIVGTVEAVEPSEVDYDLYTITKETTVMVVRETETEKGEVWLFTQDGRHLLATGNFHETSMEDDIVYVGFSGEVVVETECPYVGYRTY